MKNLLILIFLSNLVSCGVSKKSISDSVNTNKTLMRQITYSRDERPHCDQENFGTIFSSQEDELGEICNGEEYVFLKPQESCDNEFRLLVNQEETESGKCFLDEFEEIYILETSNIRYICTAKKIFSEFEEDDCIAHYL